MYGSEVNNVYSIARLIDSKTEKVSKNGFCSEKKLRKRFKWPDGYRFGAPKFPIISSLATPRQLISFWSLYFINDWLLN